MFEGLKNLAGMANMARQAGDLQKKVAELKERIGRMEVEGFGGGDAVLVRMTGDFRVIDVQIHHWLVEARNQSLLQQLTREAFNSAMQRARDLAAEEMAKLAEEMDMPGMKDAFSRLGFG
jgi:DNA-binding YbaB/EbfC family protein